MTLLFWGKHQTKINTTMLKLAKWLWRGREIGLSRFRFPGVTDKRCDNGKLIDLSELPFPRSAQSLSWVWHFVSLWTIVAHQAPLSLGVPRQEYWSGLPFPSPGDLPDPGIAPASPALQADSLPLCHLGSLLIWYYGANNTDFTGLCVLSLSRLGEEFYNML